MFAKVSQRTVKCRVCGKRDFYIWHDDATGVDVLRSTAGLDHEHPPFITQRSPQAPRPFHVERALAALQNNPDDGDVEAPQAPTEPAPIAPQFVTTIAGESATPDAGDAEHAFSMQIPKDDNVTRYVPRKLNGHTDVQTLVSAFEQNLALCKAGERPLNVMMISDTGAGKNHLVRAASALLKAVYVRFSFTAGATLDGMFGKYNLTKTAQMEWQDGRLTAAVRYASRTGRNVVVCLDEMNACPPEIAFSLHAALDDERVLFVDDRPEVLHIAPTVLFVGTMNPDYRGTKPLNEAFKSRFALTLALDYEPSVEKKLVINDKLLKVAKQLRQQYRTGDGTVSTPVSTRLLLDFERNEKLFGQEIARDSFIAAFPSEEQSSVREILGLNLDVSQPIDITKDINLDEIK